MAILARMGRQESRFSDAFARVIQARRKAQGLSRNALSEKAGLHQTYIGLIERGINNPTLETCHAIAQALNTSVSKMAEEAEEALAVESKSKRS